MTVPFLDLAAQLREIRPEVEQAITEVVTTASFIGGKHVAAFESAFSSFVGTKHCVGVGNGTDALELALRSLSLPSEGEVIVPANSFIGSSEAVTNAGLRVRFCDVDETYTLDLDECRRLITDRTVALMPVHLYGQPARLDGILRLADEYGLAVVEDCAQAHGATYRGRHVGSFGHLAAFSFYPGKNLGAYGDGGAVVTNDPELARRVRMSANHGRLSKYDHEVEGRNSRLDALQAAVLSVKLPHLDSWIRNRRTVAAAYREGLAGVGDLRFQVELSGAESAHHLFPIATGHRERLREHLKSSGIQTGVHYPTALPDLPAYRHLKQRAPRSSAFAGTLLSLPMGDHLDGNAVDRVVGAVRYFYQR